MKVIIRKPDLDTCLTALILGVEGSDEVILVSGDASEEDIMNPDVLSIEAGGSGLVHLNNFDLHDTKTTSPCVQPGIRLQVPQLLPSDIIASFAPHLPVSSNKYPKIFYHNHKI